MPTTSLMVLESSWSDEITTPHSTVKPFFDGFGATLQRQIAYQNFHDERSLRYWLRQFFTSNIPILYIAGHGRDGYLRPLGETKVDFGRLVPRCLPNKKVSEPLKPKGIMLGACSIGGTEYREDILQRTRHPLTWLATYDRTVPWIETTLFDLLFLSYLLEGRCVQKNGEFLLTKTNIMRTNKAKHAEHAYDWLVKDCALAAETGFGVSDRRAL